MHTRQRGVKIASMFLDYTVVPCGEFDYRKAVLACVSLSSFVPQLVLSSCVHNTHKPPFYILQYSIWCTKSGYHTNIYTSKRSKDISPREDYGTIFFSFLTFKLN